MSTPVSVLHVSHSDLSGGAAIAAYRLHTSLREINVSSRMAVAMRRSGDANVIEMPRPTGLVQQVLQKAEALRLRQERLASSRRQSPRLESFADDRVPGRSRLDHRPVADVLHLHWVADFVDWGRFFSQVRYGQPLVWTLHDMNPMTGGCHYSLGCDRFVGACGACPLLGSASPGDITRRIFARKLRALSGLNPKTTRIVAPSTWLKREASRSALLGRFDIEVIPNGVDTSVFVPQDKEIARKVFGLPTDRPVVLFVADNLQNHRKGIDLLIDAVERLPHDMNVVLAAIGSNLGGLPTNIVPLGRIDNERIMSFAYSTADIFVSPTRAEAFGQVLIEAMACGVPTVSFAVGGVTDVIRPGVTGELAAPEDSVALAECMRKILRNPAEGIQRLSRETAVDNFDILKVARRYGQVYDDLLAAARGAHEGS